MVTWFEVGILSRNLTGGTAQNQRLTGARPKPATHCLWRKVRRFLWYNVLSFWNVQQKGKKYSSARGKIPARLRYVSVCCEFKDVQYKILCDSVLRD
jgi:hypothetical protein